MSSVISQTYLQCVCKQNNEVFQIQHQIGVVAVWLEKKKVCHLVVLWNHKNWTNPIIQPLTLQRFPVNTMFLRGGSWKVSLKSGRWFFWLWYGKKNLFKKGRVKIRRGEDSLEFLWSMKCPCRNDCLKTTSAKRDFFTSRRVWSSLNVGSIFWP